MSIVNLNRLAVFAAVVDTGSFTAAAKQLRLTKGAVSQHVLRLEEEIGATLLIRTTRRVTPTETGAAFHLDCRRILADTETALARIGDSRMTVSGQLRITTTVEYGAAVVAPALADFAKLHPQLTIDLLAVDHVIDLVAERLDLAIRAGWLRDSRHRATRLSSLRQVLVAAPQYLGQYGIPRKPADLAQHRWVTLPRLASTATSTFTPRRGKPQVAKVTAVVQTNSTMAMKAFVVHGSGIATFPEHVVADDISAGTLVPLLTNYGLPEAGIYAVYPAMRHVPPKVRLFIDFLKTRLSARAAA